jgi:hypothetical protein
MHDAAAWLGVGALALGASGTTALVMGVIFFTGGIVFLLMGDA